MKKKIIIMLMFILMFSSIVYATRNGDVEGKYYHTDIQAYFNGEQIDSWNISGKTLICIEDFDKYGFSIKWNEELREIYATYDSQPNIQTILLKQISEPLYKDEYTDWIQKTVPETTPFAGPHGRLYAPGSTNDEITIEFAQKISPNYINSKYIPIFMNDKNVSNKFDYIFDKEQNVLKLKLVNHDINSTFEATSYDTNGKINKNLIGKDFIVYLSEDISTVNGEKLPMTFRLDGKILWESDVNTVKIGDVAGEYFYTDMKAYLNGRQLDTWNIDGKTLINIDGLYSHGCKIEWDGKLRVIKMTFNPQVNSQAMILNQISEPIYKDKYTCWVQKTVPEMSHAISENCNSVEVIDNSIDEITIKFNKKVLANYMNSKYVPIFHKNKDVSDEFDYIFDNEENILKLRLTGNSMDVISDIYGSNWYEANELRGLKGRSFDVYLLEGISTITGEKLPTTLRLTAGILWNKAE